jgi:phosphate acyltransferase
LLGLRGLVFKSHGSADVMAFEVALKRAFDAVNNNLLERVQARIAHASAILVDTDDIANSEPSSPAPFGKSEAASGAVPSAVVQVPRVRAAKLA